LNILRGAAEPIQGVFQILPVIWRLILVQLIISLIIGLIVFFLMIVILAPMAVFGFNGAQPPATFLVALVIVIPVAFCLVTYIWARLILAMAFVADRQMGVIESLSESLHYTRGNAVAIIGAFMVVSSLATFFALFTCMLGSVLAFPAVMISMALTYLLVTGQSFTTGRETYGSTADSPFAPTPDGSGVRMPEG
jgi:hypothetical protein